MFLSTTLLALTLSTPADAGKLADGFRGIPYGDAAFLKTAPSALCSPGLDVVSVWTCRTQVGPAEVSIDYVQMEGLYVGVVITSVGYANSVMLMSSVEQAYGVCVHKSKYSTDTLDDCTIVDGRAAASWSYNEFSKEGLLVITDLDVLAQVSDRKKAKAAAGVNDL